MNNKALLIVIIVILSGIAAILFVQHQEDQKSGIEKVTESISEGVEEIGDEIDDATTAR